MIKKRKPVSELKERAIELAVEGYTFDTILIDLETTKRAIDGWRSRDKNFKLAFDKSLESDCKIIPDNVSQVLAFSGIDLKKAKNPQQVLKNLTIKKLALCDGILEQAILDTPVTREMHYRWLELDEDYAIAYGSIRNAGVDIAKSVIITSLKATLPKIKIGNKLVTNPDYLDPKDRVKAAIDYLKLTKDDEMSLSLFLREANKRKGVGKKKEVLDFDNRPNAGLSVEQWNQKITTAELKSNKAKKSNVSNIGSF